MKKLSCSYGLPIKEVHSVRIYNPISKRDEFIEVGKETFEIFRHYYQWAKDRGFDERDFKFQIKKKDV